MSDLPTYEPVEVGLRNCTTCGVPHASHYTRAGLAPQWHDLGDGHPYMQESWEEYAQRYRDKLDQLLPLIDELLRQVARSPHHKPPYEAANEVAKATGYAD